MSFLDFLEMILTIVEIAQLLIDNKAIIQIIVNTIINSISKRNK